MTLDDQSQKPEESNRGLVEPLLRVVPHLVGTPLVVGLLLFLPAGDFAWEKGWLFLLVLVVASIIITLYIWRANPELLVARSRMRLEKRWDLIVGLIVGVGMVTILPVAALDDGRFHWCPVPWWVCSLGYLLFLVSMAVFTWAGVVNKFAEPGVRIQVERNHKVIDTGPYAFVRHPMYVAAVPLFAGMALCLGSLWALIPAGLAMVSLILRTQWEDQTLEAELPGYKEYTERVRFKLIPGVW
jgi:protein-S-isoprenylcysteine O-methyltransferase Ste14